MSWGINLLYYRCPHCGVKFKYAEDLIAYFGDQFGCCPRCGAPGQFEFSGPRALNDGEYEEVEE